MNKKLVSVVLTATTLVWGLGIATLPLVANAQTTAGLQAQIAALLAQIQQLQAQLNTAKGGSSSSCYSYTRDLTVGSKGADVSALQQLLINAGDLTAVTAPTGYFGPLTKAALAKYQAANSISPAAGFFGPITRAFVTSSCVSTPTNTGTGTGTGTGSTVTPPATGLSVSLAADNPAAGPLVASASGSNGGSSARVAVLAFDLSAANSGAVTVSQLQFQKTGVVPDASISNAYLVQNNQVVAQYSSLSNGVLTFSGLNFSVPAGQTVEYQVAVGLSSGSVSPGNTVSFALSSASGVTAVDSSNNSVTASGSFPINGNTFTVTTVNNPPLATLTVDALTVGQSVTAGTQGAIVGAFNFNVGVNPVYLQNVNFHVIGSANDANIQNVKLMVNGTQFGQTLSAVPATGLADFSGNTKLNTGSNNVQVVADIMGSPNMNFQFEILNSYDVLASDSQYNVPIAVTNTGGTASSEQVSIQYGQITMSQDANTPTGNVAKGMSNVVLSKFDIYAAGEPVKVQWLDFNIQLNGVSNGDSLDNEIQNVSLTDDAGNQIGTTITAPPSGMTCTPASGAPTSNYGTGGTSTNFQTANVTYADCFGTSGSPINYIVPANTTRVLSLKADIQSTADFSTITGNLSGDTNNLLGQVSSKTTSSGAASGVSLTLVSSSLTATMNNALGNQNVSAGTAGIKIGSYSLSASSAEGVNLNTISVEIAPGTTTWNGGQTAFQNLKLMVNGTQFGQTWPTVSPGSTYVFTGSLAVPQGGTVNVDVYADSLSNATGTYNPATDLVGYTGTGAIAYDVVNFSSTVVGQTLSFSGQPALQVALDASSPAASLIPQQTSNNTLAVYRFTETSNVEAVKVTQLNITEAVSSSSANFSNLQLYSGSTLLGTAGAPSLTATDTWTYSFNSLTNPLVVPAGSSLLVSLTGTAGSYTNGSMADNSTSTFAVATSTIVARGATSNKTAAVSGSATSNTLTVLRSIEAVTGVPVATLPPASFQQIGAVQIASNIAGDTQPHSLTLTFNSTANSAFLGTVALKDAAGNVVATPTVSTSSETVSWTIPSNYVVSAGQQYTFTVWGDLSQIPAVSNQSQALTAQIKNATDYEYLDGTTGSPSTISLLPNQVPITVVSLTSTVGGPF